MFSKSPLRVFSISSLFILQVAQAYDLVFYTGSGCRGQRLGNIVLGPTRDDECKREYYGNAGSILVQSTGAVDDSFMVVLFNSSDCNPDNEVRHGDESDFCLEEPYAGWQVWDMSDA
jgi:hypothetical protein